MRCVPTWLTYCTIAVLSVAGDWHSGWPAERYAITHTSGDDNDAAAYYAARSLDTDNYPEGDGYDHQA